MWLCLAFWWLGSTNLSVESWNRKVSRCNMISECQLISTPYCITLYHWVCWICRLVDEFHGQLGGHEAASDGIITDLDYSSEMWIYVISYILIDTCMHRIIPNNAQMDDAWMYITQKWLHCWEIWLTSITTLFRNSCTTTSYFHNSCMCNISWENEVTFLKNLCATFPEKMRSHF